jgi:acyl-CoA thioesterase-1
LGVTGPILFIGDSITDCDRLTDNPDHLGYGYVRLIAGDRPESTVINVGVSGNRIGDLRGRWQADVVDRHPDILSVYVGINDTWRRFDEDDPTSPGFFEDTYRECLEDLGGASLLVLVEPFVVPVNAEQELWHDDLSRKREVVARLAREFGARFVPLHAIMSAAAEEHGAAAIAEDGVHPTDLGHRMIADAWLEAAGL